MVNDIHILGGDNGSGRTDWLPFQWPSPRALTLNFCFPTDKSIWGESYWEKGKLVPKLVPSVHNIDATQPIIMHYPFRITRWTTLCTNIKP